MYYTCPTLHNKRCAPVHWPTALPPAQKNAYDNETWVNTKTEISPRTCWDKETTRQRKKIELGQNNTQKKHTHTISPRYYKLRYYCTHPSIYPPFPPPTKLSQQTHKPPPHSYNHRSSSMLQVTVPRQAAPLLSLASSAFLSSAESPKNGGGGEKGRFSVSKTKMVRRQHFHLPPLDRRQTATLPWHHLTDTKLLPGRF